MGEPSTEVTEPSLPDPSINLSGQHDTSEFFTLGTFCTKVCVPGGSLAKASSMEQDCEGAIWLSASLVLRSPHSCQSLETTHQPQYQQCHHIFTV